MEAHHAEQHLIFKSFQQLRGQLTFTVHGFSCKTLWGKFTNAYLDPKLWDWKLDGAVFTPVMTNMNAAPDSLLKFTSKVSTYQRFYGGCKHFMEGVNNNHVSCKFNKIQMRKNPVSSCKHMYC